MSSTLNALDLIAASLLMLLAGVSKKRLEWKRRDRSQRGRKPRV